MILFLFFQIFFFVLVFEGSVIFYKIEYNDIQSFILSLLRTLNTGEAAYKTQHSTVQ